MGYSWGIHGVFICIGYVSVMYRLCVGYVTEHTGSEGVNKEDNIDNSSYLAFARTNDYYRGTNIVPRRGEQQWRQ